jgi:glycosyltransferase involved in cell wall biosynthesis
MRSEIVSPKISIVFAYYSNPKMLRYQVEQYGKFDPAVLKQCEILVIDDASPSDPAAEVVVGFKALPLSVFRIDKDKPWNQDAARNIGAFEATGKFLLLTDIDHTVPEESIKALLAMGDTNQVHSLAREAHFFDKVVKSHGNSYFMSKAKYWEIGGYDEDFWGAYGSDVLFRKRIIAKYPIVELRNIRLELVTKISISDAKNLNLSRSPSAIRRGRSIILRLAKSLKIFPSPRVLRNAYRRVF